MRPYLAVDLLTWHDLRLYTFSAMLCEAVTLLALAATCLAAPVGQQTRAWMNAHDAPLPEGHYKLTNVKTGLPLVVSGPAKLSYAPGDKKDEPTPVHFDAIDRDLRYIRISDPGNSYGGVWCLAAQ